MGYGKCQKRVRPAESQMAMSPRGTHSHELGEIALARDHEPKVWAEGGQLCPPHVASPICKYLAWHGGGAAPHPYRSLGCLVSRMFCLTNEKLRKALAFIQGFGLSFDRANLWCNCCHLLRILAETVWHRFSGESGEKGGCGLQLLPELSDMLFSQC